MEHAGMPARWRYAFGPFVLDPLRRAMWHDGATRVALAPRPFSALQLLVEQPGELLRKDRLMAELWPGLVVEENSLSQVIAALRRALGEQGRRYVQTEARRGFRFVCPVTRQPEPAGAGLQPVAALDGLRDTGFAVLPFHNLNLERDPDQDCLVAGLMEELVVALTNIPSLLVIAGSATHRAGEALSPELAARRLGVRYLLEGSVRRCGTRVRVAARITDALTSTHVWARRFEEAIEDPFALQDRVALSVAGVIEPALRQSRQPAW